MSNYVILGIGYGDEGKGLVTDYYTSICENPLVVRFNGGHQAGHTVMMKDGKRHVFSNFGSGTLRGAPSYWSKYCTSEPVGMLEERKALVKLGVNPVLYVDALSPVTTPWDIAYNKTLEREYRHGSVGVGFGATIERNENHVKLFVQDLPYKNIVREKMDQIKQYYYNKIQQFPEGSGRVFDIFLRFNCEKEYNAIIEEYLSHIRIVKEKQFLGSLHNDLIFEGAQGTMLDMDFGFFPNVTRSNTTCKNAMQIINQNRLEIQERTKIVYLTRAYQTRHGHGFMSNTDKLDLLKLKDIENETNVFNEWQSNFRRSLLDLDLLKYAIECNRNFITDQDEQLIITCRNQIDGEFLATRDNKVLNLSDEVSLMNAVEKLNIPEFYLSHTPYSEDMDLF